MSHIGYLILNMETKWVQFFYVYIHQNKSCIPSIPSGYGYGYSFTTSDG